MDSLVANAIHDLKNSLHVLNSWLSEAERKAPLPELVEARALASHLNRQLVQLLVLYRYGTGQLQLAIDDRDLRAFLEELRSEPLHGSHAAVTVDYDLAAADSIGTWAFDAYQVKLVLADAVRNAVRHARQRVTVGIERDPHGGIALVVQDDGPGFPEAILANDEPRMADNGSGLGLRFARLVASRHRTPDGRNGTITLTNTGRDGGACWRLYLP